MENWIVEVKNILHEECPTMRRDKQEAELERALGQLDGVETSRNVLRVKYKSQKGGDLMLNIDAHAAKGIPPGKKAGSRKKQGETRPAAAQKAVSAKAPGKERLSIENAGASSDIVADTSKLGRRGRGKKQKAPAEEYRDPASDRTWSGRGRKPFGCAATHSSIWYRICK